MKKILLCLCTVSALFAQVGKIVSLRGDVVLVRGGVQIKAHNLDELEESDTIKTSDNARLQVRFIDDTIITLGKNASLNVNKYLIDGKQSRVDLAVNSGSYKVISGKISKLARKNFIFKAHTATIGIRGTVFVGELSKMDEVASKVGCLDGAIDVNVAGKLISLNAGYEVDYLKNKIFNIRELNIKSYEVTKPLKTDNALSSNDVKTAALVASTAQISPSSNALNKEPKSKDANKMANFYAEQSRASTRKNESEWSKQANMLAKTDRVNKEFYKAKTQGKLSDNELKKAYESALLDQGAKYQDKYEDVINSAASNESSNAASNQSNSANSATSSAANLPSNLPSNLPGLPGINFTNIDSIDIESSERMVRETEEILATAKADLAKYQEEYKNASNDLERQIAQMQIDATQGLVDSANRDLENMYNNLDVLKALKAGEFDKASSMIQTNALKTAKDAINKTTADIEKYNADLAKYQEQYINATSDTERQMAQLNIDNTKSLIKMSEEDLKLFKDNLAMLESQNGGSNQGATQFYGGKEYKARPQYEMYKHQFKYLKRVEK